MAIVPPSQSPTGARALPRSIWALGFVSLLMDSSSELVHSLLPLFLVTGLGAGTLAVGVIDGFGEATASIVKVFSGRLSDWFGKRKALTLIGYGLAAASKPLFPLATSADWVFGARFLDRIGKGIRGAPRDALIADITPPEQRGAAYGLRQSLDTVGAVAGPLLAILLMRATGDHFRLVFWLAVVPALLSVLVLAIGVAEPRTASSERPDRLHISRADAAALGFAFWALVAVAMLLHLARISEAFLLLRAQSTGLRLDLVPGVLVVMNIVYAAAVYPAGRASDRIGRFGLLTGGFVMLILSLVVLALATQTWVAILGALLWGLQMAMTQGLLAALVADSAPGQMRGTAFGLFNLATGLAMIPGNILVGFLWDRAGPAVGLGVAAALALLALLGLLLWRATAGKA